MSRRKTIYGKGQKQQWQSAVINDVYYLAYRTMIERIALARFKWHNVPSTIDPAALERQLLYKGSVSIAAPAGNPHMIYALEYAQIGRPDAYLRPKKWRTCNPYAQKYEADWTTGAICYENAGNIIADSLPTIEIIDVFARELADLARTRQINRQQQKTPFIIKVPRELEAVANSILDQKYGNEPAIIATENFAELVQIEVFPTNVQYLAELFNSDERNIWARLYQFLGVGNLPFKAERQIRDEVNSQQDPTDLSTLSYLDARNAACKHLNKLYNLDMFVTWNNDIVTTNYDFAHDIAYKHNILNGVE